MKYILYIKIVWNFINTKTYNNNSDTKLNNNV